MHTTAREGKKNSNEITKIRKMMETKSENFTETATNENDEHEQTDDNSDNNNDKQRAPKQTRR
jgi:hypothetical protein